ncbi:hypothetical protein KC19_2G051800 [Ceratodon purpureus]|uniref:Uncharacterized protein n=1 Tax=Ceratodon purpureus TaxID=3225 RepID=A0A8T0IT60_CERPU|nr:hypothetical protein KC19_2G051800 [Ceratodon purpureus]
MSYVIHDYPGPGAYSPNKEACLPQPPAFTIAKGRWPKELGVSPGPGAYTIRRKIPGPAFSIARRCPQRYERQLPRPPVPPKEKKPQEMPPNEIIHGIGRRKHHEQKWK